MSTITPEILFREINGSVHSGFAAIDSPVRHSPGGVLYLVRPGVVILARPNVDPAGFLSHVLFPSRRKGL